MSIRFWRRLFTGIFGSCRTGGVHQRLECTDLLLQLVLSIFEIPVFAFDDLSEQLNFFPLLWILDGMVFQVSDHRILLDALWFWFDLGSRDAACWLYFAWRARRCLIYQGLLLLNNASICWLRRRFLGILIFIFGLRNISHIRWSIWDHPASFDFFLNLSGIVLELVVYGFNDLVSGLDVF